MKTRKTLKTVPIPRVLNPSPLDEARRINGDCMNPHYRDGDIVGLRPITLDKLVDGEAHVVNFVVGTRGVRALKRVYRDPNNARRLILTAADFYTHPRRMFVDMSTVISIRMIIWRLVLPPKLAGTPDPVLNPEQIGTPVVGTIGSKDGSVRWTKLPAELLSAWDAADAKRVNH